MPMKPQRDILPHLRFRPVKLAILVVLAMAAGCDDILGIDDLAIGCVEGQRRCTGDNAPEVCNAYGVWERKDACVNATCIAGACAGQCVAGQNDCDEKIPKNCNEAGLWEFEAACEYACFEGKCACEPGQTRCIGNTLGICNENRTWQDEECIEQTCISTNPMQLAAECVGVCAPGRRCLGNTPQACDTTGHWQGDVPCAAGEQCKAGECIAVCTPKNKRCFDNKKQTCDENGQWQDDIDALCAASTCDPDTVECVGVCAPDEKQCKDVKTPQACGAKGQWQDESTCAIACVSGACTSCVPGEIGCDGNAPQSCGIDGQWQVGAPCAGQTCVMGVCQGECAPGKRCLGNTPQICDDAGQWQGSTPCGVEEECKAGSCSCIPDDLRCFNNTPQLCNAAKEWEDTSAPCVDQTCDPDVAACVGVCAPEQAQCLDANTVQHCDAKGKWQTTATCVIGCFAGACASCTTGQMRCTGNTPQSCGINGQWQDETTCDDQTCVAGTCQGECAFESLRCAGNWPQICNPAGAWQSLGQPCAVGETCYEGECDTSCPPGATRCAGDSPQICAANGTWQNNGPVCGTCIECDPNTALCEPAPAPLSVCMEPTMLAAGWWHTCALFPNGTIKCWGANEYGQLGLGDTINRGDNSAEMGMYLPTVDLGLPPGVTVTAISGGRYHTCALMSDGRVKCWGSNEYGRLGLGDTNHRGDAPGEMGANLPFLDFGLPAGVTVTSIGTGNEHGCILSSDGRVKCWGRNDAGTLGLGNTSNRGDQPGEMGANLPFVNLGLPVGVTVAALSVNASHACALSSDARIKCWGINFEGSLGLGDTNHRGDQPTDMGVNLPFVDVGLSAGVTVASINAASNFSCVLTSDARVKCWGRNCCGELGLGSTSNIGDTPGEMGTNLPFVDLGLPVGINVAKLSLGFGAPCAILSNGKIKCWGSNYAGGLGLGDKNNRGDSPGEMGANLPYVDLGLGVTVTSIRKGASHTCAILLGGSVKCWGDNAYGQLGLFDTLDRGDEPNEMGDNLPIVDL